VTDKATSFSTTDIRPEALMDEQARLFALDVERLVANKPDFVAVACPACGADESRPLWEKMGIDYVGCSICRTIYVSPRPQPHHLVEYYQTSENYQYWAERIFPASEGVRRERIFRPRVDRLLELCERHGVDQGRAVEVGPGFGTFCQELSARAAFGSVMAIEPTPALAAACRSRGVDVIEAPVEEVDLEELGGADVVASFEVIEHLFEPGAFLRAVFRLLRPGGLLVLSCPNGLGFEVQQLGSRSTTVDAEHLNYFNPVSLAIVLGAAGFEVLETSTPGVLDADLVRTAVLDGSTTVDDDPFLRAVLVDEWDRWGAPFQSFLARNQMSSHLWSVARRPR
jgi:SAM-dependent methyltransferase